MFVYILTWPDVNTIIQLQRIVDIVAADPGELHITTLYNYTSRDYENDETVLMTIVDKCLPSPPCDELQIEMRIFVRA